MSLPARRAGRFQPRPETRSLRLRLIDAVALAAVGLLVLKLASLAITGAPSGPPPPGTPLPDFARALAKARTGYEPTDPATTGSVNSKESNKPVPDTDAGAKAERPAEFVPPETVSPTERAILEKLGARRDALKVRQDALDLREQMIGQAERKLEAGVGELKQAEEKGDAGGSKGQEAEKAGLRSIVTMYETMKPKDAARVFDRLPLDVLVPIVLAMNPRKMAEVLAVMQAEAAEKLTVALANRARGIDGTPGPQLSAGLPPNELPAIDPGPPGRPPLR